MTPTVLLAINEKKKMVSPEHPGAIVDDRT